MSDTILRTNLYQVKSPIEYDTTKNCVYSLLSSSGKVYKGETYHPIKVKLKEHRKAVVPDKIENSGVADYIWKEKETVYLYGIKLVG